MTRHPFFIWMVTLFYWMGIFTLTHLPAHELPRVHVSDKIEHLLAYFGLATVLFLSLWASRPTWSDIGMRVLAICLVYALLDELLQIPVGRDAELLDWMADAAGASVAVVLWTVARMIVVHFQGRRMQMYFVEIG
jgi:VanZ family protein